MPNQQQRKNLESKTTANFNFFKKNQENLEEAKKKKVAFLNARKKLYKTMIEEDFLVGQNLMNF